MQTKLLIWELGKDFQRILTTFHGMKKTGRYAPGVSK